MMMSKPTEEKSKAEPDAVADLERRLAMLSSSKTATITNGTTPAASASTTETPAFAVAPPAPAVESGKSKNALLARIMAAQEKAKQAQQGGPPAAPSATAAPDLLSMDAPPAGETTTTNPPPPAFDSSVLPDPQQEAPPPAFQDSFVPPAADAAPPSTMLWDPHAPPAPVEHNPPPAFPSAPLAASAPDIGDLLSHEAPLPTAPVPPPMQFEAPPEPPQESPNDAVEAILGLEGLSDAEKQELIDEQLKIMASIENNKTSAAHNAADAFESRSFSNNVQSMGGGSGRVNLGAGRNAVVHGPERSQQAIADGTAVSVQCMSCQHWMQVTAQATLMNCPVCNTVQPVGQDAVETAQMQADMELAEQLQKEEYQQQEEREQRQRQQRTATTSTSTSSNTNAKDQGWMEWLGLSASADAATTGSPERPTSFAQAPVHRGQVGVSRPPGAGGGARLTTPTTGQEIMSAPSYDSATSQPRTARVAEAQPLFSCVADSISTALNTAMTGPPPDGVDSSSLLAMPQVRREED